MSKVITALKLLRTPDQFMSALLSRTYTCKPFTNIVFKLCDWRDSQFRRRWGGRQLPCAALRFQVCGSVDPHVFFRSGQASTRYLQRALGTVGKSLADFSSILDFGCGSGRVLLFARPLTEARFSGCDVEAQHIAFCRQHLGWVDLRVNPYMPPVDYPDASFDLIYLHSVFTHIDEASQLAWLREFQRLLQSGGTLMISVHGPDFWGRLPERYQEPLRRDGFLFLESLPGEPDGSFHTPEYIQRTWSNRFDVLKYLPLGCGGQDMVILRAPSEPQQPH